MVKPLMSQYIRISYELYRKRNIFQRYTSHYYREENIEGCRMHLNHLFGFKSIHDSQ